MSWWNKERWSQWGVTSLFKISALNSMKQLFNNWVKDLYLFLASLQNLDILFNTQNFRTSIQDAG